ncbi:protein-cysteine N-palmitoyltransferase HHAT isoform X2 [Canis lupus baileyi]|uniref:protein-cysteine N-palmitoyltransferase HHAT isoform X2 n=1 Tax=Canis lupus baileyi TaxID=143281 RepID=UPI003B97C710
MLPWWELSFYLCASLGFHFYSFYEVYKASREHEEELDRQFDLEIGTLFGGLKKDPNDFEWSFWMEWGKQRLVRFLFGHMVVSQMANVLARKHRPWILGAYGMWASWCVLGAHGTAIIFLHTLISFCVAQLRSLALTWLCSLFLLSTLRLQDVEEVKRGWYQTENEYYLLQFTLTVRCLYYTSFSLEFCWQQMPNGHSFYSFPWLVAYVFYYPVFHNGPILSFPEFIAKVQQQEYCSLKSNLSAFAVGLGRLLCYWWLAELMVHLMYMHAIYSSASLLKAVSCWTLGGLALAHVLFFYLKYLVLFGVPALLMRLDGLTPPPLPRCVSTMFSFTGMWRYFDVGLHDFLIRYVYIPVGGSQHGLLGTLFSTAVTFAFVSFWHGGYDYLWCWAALNWLGVTVENVVQRLVRTPCIQDSIQFLSPQARRRFHAALASCSTSMLILSNLVFLGGSQVGKIYWNRIFIQGCRVSKLSGGLLSSLGHGAPAVKEAGQVPSSLGRCPPLSQSRLHYRLNDPNCLRRDSAHSRVCRDDCCRPPPATEGTRSPSCTCWGSQCLDRAQCSGHRCKVTSGSSQCTTHFVWTFPRAKKPAVDVD